MQPNTALEKIQGIKNLPTLPTIVLEVNRLLQNTEASVDPLVKLLENDQTLVLKLLKLVNSSFYGFKNSVNSLRHAVMLMGYNTIQHAVVSIAAMEGIRFHQELKNFRLETFWQHAIRVAVMSRYLAASTRLMNAEEAFTAGLLHDIGKVIMVNFFPQELVAVVKQMRSNGRTFQQAEKSLGTCSHAYIGAYLATRWMLPERLVAAINGHHDMASSDHESDIMMTLVGFANNLVHMMDKDPGYYLQMDQGHSEINERIVDVLGQGTQWYADIKSEMDVACSFFNQG